MTSDNLKLEDCILKVKEITSLGVAEIIKHNDENYSFRVSTIWYSLSYYRRYIKLMQGIDSVNTTDLVFGSEWIPQRANNNPLLQKSNLLFNYFSNLYLSQLVIDSEKLTKSLKKIITIIKTCSSIEKMSNNLFIININNNKRIFERHDKYDIEKQHIFSILEIKYFNNSGPKTIPVKDVKIIDQIFSVLNTIYFLNKTSESELVEGDFLKLFC